ncbi:DUF4974 domain-containing protein [Pedobacter sp. MC2016-14]|uniref:FecR family protein n=1 Tax=Pedobacter sp. MC2016-14 TaxID=2897327 RepID=UPI001E3ADE7A|nr:FecR family protein [Pedobacter sp. MC2016-14]MCD0489154.1 DUF4974 domain-containing protein [Pedobacter sp. MC2016-14]
MKQDRLAQLLHKSISEEITAQERLEMLELIKDPENEAGVKELLFDIYQSPKSLLNIAEDKSEQILEAVFQSDRSKDEQHIMKFNPLKWVAAAAVIFAILFAGLYFYKNKDNTALNPVAKHLNDVLPGGNRATLTLADGSVISLNDAEKGTIASQAGLVITKKADGQLLYELAQQSTGSNEGFNTISTPLGGKYEVVLQDGTRVTLNAGSSITYPLSFSKDKRKITLRGEAYFEVSKDKHRPFLVSSPAAGNILAQEIEVLGTHFNINAYADEQAYVTTLLEGSVKVWAAGLENGKIIVPGEQATLTRQILIAKADLEAAIAWKNDIFYFADEPIQDVMRRLSRWYDITVVYKEPITKIGFWGQISRNKTLAEVLDDLEATKGVHFKIEGRRVTVMQ